MSNDVIIKDDEGNVYDTFTDAVKQVKDNGTLYFIHTEDE